MFSSAWFSLYLLLIPATPSNSCQYGSPQGQSRQVLMFQFHLFEPLIVLPSAREARCSCRSVTSFCGHPRHSLCLASGRRSHFLDLMSSSCLVSSPMGTCHPGQIDNRQYPNPFSSWVQRAECKRGDACGFVRLKRRFGGKGHSDDSARHACVLSHTA